VKGYFLIAILSIVAGISIFTLADISSTQITLTFPLGGEVFNKTTDSFWWNLTAPLNIQYLNCTLHGNWSSWPIVQNAILLNATENTNHSMAPLSYGSMMHGRYYTWGIECYNISDSSDSIWSTNESLLYWDQYPGISLNLESPLNGAYPSFENVTLAFNLSSNLTNGLYVNCSLFVNSTVKSTWVRQYINSSAYLYEQYNLTGLSNQTYNWSVSCVDSVFGTSSNQSATYVFHVNLSDTTAPVLQSISNITTNQTIMLTWTTDDAANATVYMNGTPMYNTSLATTLVQYRTALDADTTYLFNITSCNAVQNCSNFGPYSITTDATVDTTPPLLLAISNTTTNSTISINFTTDKLCNSSAFGNLTTTENSTWSQTFSVHWNSLDQNTSYSFNLTLCSQTGYCSDFGPFNMQTNATPDQTDPWVSSLSNVTTNESSQILITPSEAANLSMKWGSSATSMPSTNVSAIAASHTIYLNGLSELTSYYLNITLYDAFSNRAEYGPFHITTSTSADLVAPTVTSIWPGNNTWHNGTLDTFNFTATDGQASSMSCTLYINGSMVDSTIAANNTAEYMNTVVTEGYYYWYVRCTDGYNPASSEVRVLKIDTTGPTASLTNPVSGWINQDYNVTILATDAGAGTNLVKARLFNSSYNDTLYYFMSSNISFNINMSGTWSMYVSSTDSAGNNREQSFSSIRLDKVNPLPSYDYDNTWKTTNYVITLSGSDTLSGVDYIRHNNTDSSVTNSSAISISTEGSHRLRFNVYDNAGNIAGQDIVAKLDKTAPSISASVSSGTAGSNSWYTTPIQVTLTATDNVSGISLTQYSTNGSTWYNYSGPVNLEEGNSTLYYRTYDNAGQSSSSSSSFNIDQYAPGILGVSGDHYAYANEVAYFTINATDAESGIAYYKITSGTHTVASRTTTANSAQLAYNPDFDGSFITNTNAMGNRSFNITACNNAGTCTSYQTWILVYNIFGNTEFDSLATSMSVNELLDIQVNVSNTGNANANFTLHFAIYRNNFDSASLVNSYTTTVQVNSNSWDMINYSAWNATAKGVYLVRVSGYISNTVAKALAALQSDYIEVDLPGTLSVAPDTINISMFADRVLHKSVYVSNTGSQLLGLISVNSSNDTLAHFVNTNPFNLPAQSFVAKQAVINTTGLAPGTYIVQLNVIRPDQYRTLTINIEVMSDSGAMLSASVDKIGLSSNETDSIGDIIVNLTNIGDEDATRIRVSEYIDKRWVSLNQTTIPLIAENGTGGFTLSFTPSIIGNLTNYIVITYNNSGSPTWTNRSIRIPVALSVFPTGVDLTGDSEGYNSTYTGVVSLDDSVVNNTNMEDTTLEDSNTSVSVLNRTTLVRSVLFNVNMTDSDTSDSDVNDSIVENSTIRGSSVVNLTVRNANITGGSMYTGSFENSLYVVEKSDTDVSISVTVSEDNSTNTTSFSASVSGTGILIRLDSQMLDAARTDVLPDNLAAAMSNLSSQSSSNMNSSMMPALIANASMDISYNGTNESSSAYNATYTLTNTSAKGHALIAVPVRSTVIDQSSIVVRLRLQNSSLVTLGLNDYASNLGYYYIDDSLLMIYVEVDPVISLYLPKASSPPPPPSGGSSGGGSSRNVCSPSWTCTDWSACSITGYQKRTCTDANSCVGAQPPITSMVCTPPENEPAKEDKEDAAAEEVEEEKTEPSEEPEPSVEPSQEPKTESVPFLQKTRKYSPYAIGVFAFIASIAIIFSFMESRKTRI